MADLEANAALEAWPYPDVANPDLLDRIPLDARTVLDIGCGTGALGAAYKRLNPRARVLGLEPNLAAARIAASRLDQVAHMDAEAAALPFDLPDGIDCLIYGDVLEHMKNPWAVLREHARKLSPDGVLIACVPNVEHWSMVAALLRGNFDYQDNGLFDRQHLRWFTRDMLQRAFTDAGLVPVDVATRVFEVEAARAFAGALAPTLTAIGIDPSQYLARAAPLQYVWRARRQAVEPLTVVSTMLAPVGGVSQVRVADPLRGLSSIPGIRASVWTKSELPAAGPNMPSIFIFHRPALAGEGGIRALKTLLSQGQLIVTEFDDDPSGIPVLQRPDMWNFRGVHAVQTTTPALAEVLRQENPEVMVFPNALRFLPTVRNFAQLPAMTLFFGGLNRENDWPPFIPALNAVAQAVGDRLKFSVVHDRAFFDALESPHKVFTPTCDYPKFLELLSQSEISFMPLADNRFNRGKSDLKFIEAAGCRVAALATPTVYGDSIQDGVTGVLFHDPEELRHRLLHMIANPDAARAIGDAARSWVGSHRMLAYQTAQRVAWYRSLWARREELNQALMERMPELRVA